MRLDLSWSDLIRRCEDFRKYAVLRWKSKAKNPRSAKLDDSATLFGMARYGRRRRFLLLKILAAVSWTRPVYRKAGRLPSVWRIAYAQCRSFHIRQKRRCASFQGTGYMLVICSGNARWAKRKRRQTDRSWICSPVHGGHQERCLPSKVKYAAVAI